MLWDNSTNLMKALGGQDVRLYLKKRGDHRLLADEDLYLQLTMLRELLDTYPVADGPPPPPSRLAVDARTLREGGVLGGEDDALGEGDLLGEGGEEQRNVVRSRL